MNDVTNILPTAYQWLKEQNLVGYEPFSQLQPWYYLTQEKCFWVDQLWNTDKKLLVFARRQDCDLLACFKFDNKFSKFNGIYVIQGWTPDGFQIEGEYETLWEWLKSVIDDIEEWVGMV